MGEFTTEIKKRLREAQTSLRDARAEGDDFLAEARIAEIEDLERLAARHGIALS